MAAILFLEIDTEREWALASIGPALIAAYIRERGHEARFMRVPPTADPEALVPEILEYSPSVIGLSLTTGQWLRAAEVVRYIRRKIKAPVLVGGLHPTFVPEAVLASPGFDMVCLGEGEEAVCEILDILEVGEQVTPGRVANIRLRGGPRPRIRPPLRDLDRLPFMARDFLDEKHGVVHMVSRRGCPFTCSYCGARSLAELYGGYGEERSVENVIRELVGIRESAGLSYVIFLDDTFTLDRPWVDEFCGAFSERVGVGFSIHARADTVDEAMIANLARAGCRHVVYGVESGSYRVRKEVMNRPVPDEAIREAFRLTREAGMLVTANYMLGLPGETAADIEMTLAINREIDPDDFGYFVFYPYPGTPLSRTCREKGYLPADYLERPATHRESVLDLPGLSREEIAAYYGRFTQAREQSYLRRYGRDMDEAGRRTAIEIFRKEAALG